jgi:hypothetical protein
MRAIKRNKISLANLENFGFADVLTNNISGEKSLHSNKKFKVNDVLIKFSALSISNIPTYLTLQIDINQHITLEPEYLQYTNHSCNPNVFFNTTTFELIAIKKIMPGDELTFFYPSTEWNMTQAFACTCGYKDCLQNIRGAAFLSKEVYSKYMLTDFIKKMLA